MEQIYKYNENCFEIFLDGAVFLEINELIAKAIKLLIEKGKMVTYRRDDNVAIVTVDGVDYICKKAFGHIQGIRFVKNILNEEISSSNKELDNLYEVS